MKGDVINVVTRTNFGRNGINYLKNASSDCPKLEVFAPKSLSSNPDQIIRKPPILGGFSVGRVSGVGRNSDAIISQKTMFYHPSH